MASRYARYKHVCENCAFLGQFEEYDLWICLRGHTYIARYSGNRWDYVSGREFVGQIRPLTEAHRRATVQGIALNLGY